MLQASKISGDLAFLYRALDILDPSIKAKTFFYTAMYCSNTEFSENFFGALVRTFVMFTGELEYNDSFDWKEKTREEGGFKRLLTGIYFGKLIFFAFAFLFVVVVMNLLNAVAIGDIEVIGLQFTLIVMASADFCAFGP